MPPTPDPRSMAGGSAKRAGSVRLQLLLDRVDDPDLDPLRSLTSARTLLRRLDHEALRSLPPRERRVAQAVLADVAAEVVRLTLGSLDDT